MTVFRFAIRVFAAILWLSTAVVFAGDTEKKQRPACGLRVLPP